MKFLSGAVAAAILLAGAGGAHAATYTISDSTRFDGSLIPTNTYTSTTAQDVGTGPFTDYFTFLLDDPYAGAFSAAFIESKKIGSFITGATLSLYSGAVGSGTFVDTTGSFDPSTQATPTLTVDSLAAGSYYIEALVTPKKGYNANYSVNVTLGDIPAAPEPGVWALMIAGVGLAGASFRRSRKYRVNATFA